MHGLKNKDKTIKYIFNALEKHFGASFFEVVNFWDGDNYAIGFKKHDKLVYISTWVGRTEKPENLKFYTEFEIIDTVTQQTVLRKTSLENISIDELIIELKHFVEI